MAYANVPDSDLDAESPGKTGVFIQLRDNIDALYEDTREGIYKSSTETVPASTALQDDDDFVFAVASGEVWTIRMSLLVTTDDVNADLKLQITTPDAGDSGYYHVLAYNSGTSALIAQSVINSSVDLDYAAAETADPLFLTAIVSTTAAGNIKLQWAQRTAAGNTSILAGSFMEAFRSDAL